MRGLAASRPAVIFAIVGTLLVAGYACLGALQILVLNPLAAAPGRTLAQIHAELAAAGEVLSPWPVIVFVALGLLLASSVAIYAVRTSGASPAVVSLLVLGILAFGSPAYFAASFGGGMALADTFAISGGDHSPWANVLYLVSGIAVVSALAMLTSLIVRQRRGLRPQ